MNIEYKNFSSLFNDVLKKNDYISSFEKERIYCQKYLNYCAPIKAAMDCFLERKLSWFDALIGENACQLRAWKILEIARGCEINAVFTRTLKEKLTKIECLCVNLKEILSFNKSCSEEWKLQTDQAKQFKREIRAAYNEASEELRQSNYERLILWMNQISFNWEEVFLIYSFYATASKNQLGGGLDDQGFPAAQQTDYCQITQCFGFSKNQAITIGHFINKALSIMSREYVQQVAEDIKSPFLRNYLQDGYWVQNSKEVLCGPCYYEFYTLAIRAKQFGHTFLLKIRSFDEKNNRTDFLLAYRGFGVEKEFAQLSLAEILNTNVIVWEARSRSSEQQIVNFFKTHGLMKCILAFAAQHEQYPSKVKGLDLPSDPELNSLRQFAEVEGLSQTNWKIWLPKHVFCDYLK